MERHVQPPLRMRRFVCVLATLAGCQTSVADEGQSNALTPQRKDEIAVRFHMERNYDLSRAIERLLVRGQLDDARALSASLASASEPPALEAWARQAAAVRERAIALAAAPGIDEACRRAARLSEACATCHMTAGASPVFDGFPKPPPDQPTVEARMARHRWAVDRLWEGMVGNADGPWRAGLDVLAVTPLPFSAAAGDRAALATGLQQLAERTRQSAPSTPAERARAYGEILVTCAACHSGRATTSR
jgi:cytochrome c553